MIKKFKAHPLMILKFMRPTMIILLWPIVLGIVQYLTQRNLEGITGLSIIVVGVILAVGILSWSSYSLECDTEKRILIITYGFFFKRIAKIDIKKLSSVQATQNPLDYLFRAVTFKINTEAGIHNRTDFQFKLSFKHAKEISEIFYSKDDYKEIKYTALKVAILAATTSSAFTGLFVGVPIINRAGAFLGTGIENLLEEIKHISEKVENYFPPIVNTVTIILLIAYFFSFVYSFFRYVNFKLFVGQKKLEVRAGIFVRERTSFRKSAINNLKTEQTLLMQIMKRYALKVSVGGYGDTKSESEVVIPLGAKKEIDNKLSKYFSRFVGEKEGIRPKRSHLTESRFYFMPAIYLLIVGLLSIFFVITFDDLTRFIVFTTAVIAGWILCYAYMGIYEYKYATISFGDNIYARSSRGLRTYELYCPKENIGEIRLIRFIPDRYYKTCRVRVLVRSERADNIRVRHLDYETVKNQVYKCFDIE